jgi:hypothetical protein
MNSPKDESFGESEFDSWEEQFFARKKTASNNS